VRQGSLKEISEAYAARDELMHLAISLGLSPHDANVGRGMTLLDVCSGKGVVATLLARSLPEARVIMLDACAEMDLSHVAPLPNLSFEEMDLFHRDAPAALHELVTQGTQPDGAVTAETRPQSAVVAGTQPQSASHAPRDAAAAEGEHGDVGMAGVGMAEKAADFELDGVATAARTAAQVDSERGDVSGARDGLARQAPPGVVLAFGMHLCGALSPRLLSLGAHLECISAFSVCPCCIKGSLGDYVKRTARAAQRPNYDTLLETLHTLCERELGGRGDVVVRRDQLMLSPRNGFISAVKASSVRVAAGSGAPLAGAGS